MQASDPHAIPAEVEAAHDWRAVLDLLAQRRSCRDFDGSEIAPETIMEIVADGTEAPSSCNQQNWHFIVVADGERKRRAREISGGNHHFETCSALIYLCFGKGWTHGNFSIVQSVAAATYHMMISAHLRGFHCIWNAGIGDQGRLRHMLELPPSCEVIGALAIGRAKLSAPAMKAPRRPVAEVVSHERFLRPEHAVYPLRPARAYPFFRIENHRNPYAQWDPRRWTLAQIADFRGYSVWAKSPLAGVYVSRRQGDATAEELALLPELRPGAEVAELLPWGGTYTAELRRFLPAGVRLSSVDLAEPNLRFVAERLRQEGLGRLPWRGLMIEEGRLPFANGSVNAVVAPQVLEHLPDPEAMLTEISRVLKPGGTLVISARNLWSAYGLEWALRESRAQVPNQGPFRPIPAPRLRRWLAARFTVETDLGIGRGAAFDAQVMRGPRRFFCRLWAARCRRGGGSDGPGAGSRAG